MKFFRITLVFLILLGVKNSIYAQESSKKIHKEIEVNADALIQINNAFGDLNITSWDQDKVVIDVLITVNGRNSKSVEEKLNTIEVFFLLSPEKVVAETKIDEGWSFKWFSSNSSYRIDYTIKLPKTSSADLTNDYGTIRLNSLEGKARINCDYGKLIIGELYAADNILNFDYTSNSSIEYIKGGIINADYSGFDIEKAGQIKLNADYTNAYFNSIETLEFNNDYGKLITDNIGTLTGSGDYLTLKCGVLNNRLSLENEFGLINIKQIEPSVESMFIDAEYTSINLGINLDWSFSYEIDLEYSGLRSSLALEHSIENSKSTEKYYKGTFNPRNTLSTLKITSKFGSVKLNPSNQ